MYVNVRMPRLGVGRRWATFSYTNNCSNLQLSMVENFSYEVQNCLRNISELVRNSENIWLIWENSVYTNYLIIILHKTNSLTSNGSSYWVCLYTASTRKYLPEHTHAKCLADSGRGAAAHDGAVRVQRCIQIWTRANASFMRYES